jgi:predicted porin
MKKLTLVASAVLGLISTTAMAQSAPSSAVTLYGIADIGINNISGLRQGSVTRIDSGIMEGTRWGMRGNEDLGGGYRAIFTLESRVELDTGSTSNTPPSGSQLADRFNTATLMGLPAALQPAVAGVAGSIGSTVGVNLPGRLFDRQAYAGIVTPIGAFTLGRQYTPAYLITATFDAMQTSSALSSGQVASFPAAVDIRLPNTLQYGIQTGGITAAAMYGAGEVPGQSSAGQFYGLMGIYKTSDFSVGQYATVKDDNPTGLSSITATLTPQVGAATAAVVQNAFVQAFKQDGNLFHIGYKFITGVSTITVAYSRFNDKRPNNADTSSFGVHYGYALSKRTDINAILVRYDNKGLGQSAPGGNGFLGGVTSTAGADSTALQLGIRHKF